LNQAFDGRFELLVIDDGSPEPIRDLVRTGKLPDAPQIRYLRNTQNCGIATSLNNGLRASRYSHIARIDADDSWRPGKIATQFARLKQDQDLTIVGTGMNVLGDNNEVLFQRVGPDGWGELLRWAEEGNCPFAHGSILAVRWVYGLLGGYSHTAEALYCEDYDLWCTWLRFFKPAVVQAAFLDYTLSQHSISGIHAVRQSESTREITRRLSALGLGQHLPETMRSLADVLGVSVAAAGVLSYRLWRHPRPVAFVGDAGQLVQKLMPDRGWTIKPLSGDEDCTPLDGLLADVPVRRGVQAKPDAVLLPSASQEASPWPLPDRFSSTAFPQDGFAPPKSRAHGI
jgi:hypothetical protein